MNADAPTARARTYDGPTPAHLITRLLELGHDDEAEKRARSGDGYCTLAWTRILGADTARRAGALEVLEPLRAEG
ncbi:hypothetical protein ACWEQL_23775 [Kitasatospora sp. NPDC004240]